MRIGLGIDLTAVRSAGGEAAPAFTPADFAEVWSHPDGDATIVSDAFSQWNDEGIGVDDHWVQATAGRRPAVATVNGIRVLDFDGLAAPDGDYMVGNANVSTIWTSNVDEDVEATIVFNIDTVTVNTILWNLPAGSAAALRLLQFFISSNNRLVLGYRTAASGNGVINSPNDAATGGVWRRCRAIKDGGSLTFRLDGTTIGTVADCRVLVVASADGTGNAPLAIGARSDGASPFDGKIAEVAVYTTILTTEQRAEDDLRLQALVNSLNIIEPGDLTGAQVWLRPETGVTLVSNRVSEWADQTANGNDFTQLTAGNRPFIATTDLNGLDVPDFRGAEWLVGPTQATIWTDEVDEDAYIAMVLAIDTYVNNDRIISIPKTTAHADLIVMRTASAADRFVVSYSNNAAGTSTLTWTAPGTGYVLVEIIKNGANIELFGNGLSKQAATNARVLLFSTTASDSAELIGLMAREDGNSQITDGQVAELVIAKAIPSPQERAGYHLWVEETYGLTIA